MATGIIIELIEAIQNRHAVRSYTNDKIKGTVVKALQRLIEACNQESGLNIQLCVDEPEAFDTMIARYGKFENVKNYVALVGKPSEDFEEKCGYYGEKIVLKAQQLGLNSCWMAMGFSKKKSKNVLEIAPEEKHLMVISLGYGTTSGKSHKVKSIEELSSVEGTMPEWFKQGMEAAQLAPTARNQQKFRFTLAGNQVTATPGSGFFTKTDLGIAKYHFEVGAGSADWQWA